jgi:membrane protein
MKDDFEKAAEGRNDGKDQRTPPHTTARGRAADTPAEISKPGWRDILLRAKDGMNDHHISLVAAAVAFYSLSALFPGIASAIAIWGLIFDRGEIEQQIDAVSNFLPAEAATIITDQAHKVASADNTLGLAAVFGLLIALYSAGAAVRALIEGLNIIYGEEEKRGFVQLNLFAFAMTVGFLAMLLVALGVIAGIPVALTWVGWDSVSEMLITVLRWPLLFAVAAVGLSALYRYAPSRNEARWRWVSLGSLLATALWVIGSIGFSIYVTNFGSYNETYGSLGAVIILLMWFWLSAFIVLFGAQINAETEHQTAKDTTRGPPKPMGQRGAYMADTIGERK